MQQIYELQKFLKFIDERDKQIWKKLLKINNYGNTQCTQYFW